MPNRERTHPLQIYLNDKEYKIFEDKFRLSGKQSRSEFLRQLILEGFVFEINFSEIQRTNYLLSNATNNINQVAHKVNSTNSVYRSDIEQIKKELGKIWQLQRSMLSSLHLEKQ